MGRGWELTKTSWGVLRSDRSLAVFPVLAALTALLLAAAFEVPSWALFDDDQTVAGVILAVVGIYALTFAGIFFNVALAAAAAQVLNGEDATVASGIAVAKRRLGAIAGWAALVASVNIVIRGLAERAGPLGDLLLGGIAVAWNLVTFLAVPGPHARGHGADRDPQALGPHLPRALGRADHRPGSIGDRRAHRRIVPVAILALIGSPSAGPAAGPDRPRGGRR